MTADMQQQLQQIWENRRGLIEQRLVTLEEAVRALQSGPLPADRRAQAVEAAHKLAGTLGAFGLHKASLIALEAEGILRDDTPSSQPLLQAAQQLRASIESGPHIL